MGLYKNLNMCQNELLKVHAVQVIKGTHPETKALFRMLACYKLENSMISIII